MSYNGTHWPPVNSKDSGPLKFMLISNQRGQSSMIEEPFLERMKFWDELNLPWETDTS